MFQRALESILTFSLLTQEVITPSKSSSTALISNGAISDDVYFYGQSPAIYPSPNGTGRGDWAESYKKARSMVNNLTLEEKVSLTGGWDAHDTGCVGAIPPIERVGFPGLCLMDGGNGVRWTDFVNGYASGLSIGASWNKELAALRGEHMAREFRTKGVNVLLGPVVGPMGRVVSGGRNWEAFSSDPYQTGQLVATTLQGMHSVGMITSTKHFIANEQETNRRPGDNQNGKTVEAVSSNIDDKTMHELYLWPFVDALKAGGGNIMCSYQRVNNSYACQNSKLINGILKDELGFEGFLVSDWNAQTSGMASAEAGLDMMMPTPSEFWGSHLVEAVKNGSLPVSRVDDMAIRILAAWYQAGQDKDYPAFGVGMPKHLTKPHPIVNARDPRSKPVLFDGAVEGHVLVKNENHALPLKKVKLLSLFGYDAISPQRVNVGDQDWHLGLEDQNYPGIGKWGHIITGGGSGCVSPAYWNSPFDAFQQRAYEHDFALAWDFIMQDNTTIVDPMSDAAIVFINAWASEGYDRPNLSDEYSDALVRNVASQHNNTIVVIHNAGIRLVDDFADNPNVTAILYAHLPGQDSGRALTALLFGDENFSGRLPYTVARKASDYGALERPDEPDEFFEFFPQSNFTEAVYIDYKYFDLKNIKPRYEFGFGLSYTTFTYSNLIITPLNPSSKGPFPTSQVLQGGPVDLWDEWYNIEITIRNAGRVAGKDVPQLYLEIPSGPKRQLRGFEKVLIQPDDSKTVRFVLTRRDLGVWDVVAQKWRVQEGRYGVMVGRSSRDLVLGGVFVI